MYVRTNQSVGVFVFFQFVPHHVEVLTGKIHRESHPEVVQVHAYRGITEPLGHCPLRYKQLSVAKRDRFDVLGFERDSVVDVDFVQFRFESDSSRV